MHKKCTWLKIYTHMIRKVSEKRKIKMRYEFDEMCKHENFMIVLFALANNRYTANQQPVPSEKSEWAVKWCDIDLENQVLIKLFVGPVMCKLYISSCFLFGTLFAFFLNRESIQIDLFLSFYVDFFHFIHTFVIQKWTEFQKHAHKSAVYFQNEWIWTQWPVARFVRIS